MKTLINPKLGIFFCAMNFYYYLCAAFFILGSLRGSLYAQLPPPGGLTGNVANGAVTLQWLPIPSASPTAYFIYRSLVENTATMTDTPPSTPSSPESPIDTFTITPTPSPITSVLAGTSSYIDYQVTNGRTYLYQVNAIDISGLGFPASVLVIPYGPAEAITQLTIQNNQHSGALDLYWGIPSSTYPVSIYQIFRYDVTTTPIFTPTLTNTPSNTPMAIMPPPQLTPWNTPTNSYTPTKTSTFTVTDTPTYTPTGTRSPTSTPTNLFPASAVLTLNPNPIAITSDNTYSDIPVPSSENYFYVVQAVDSQGNPGLLPTYAAGPAGVKYNLPPDPPVLMGFVPVTPTPTYGVQLYWNGPLASEGVTVYTLISNETPIATFTTPSPTMGYLDFKITESNNSGNPTTYQVVASSAVTSSNSNPIQLSISKSSLSGQPTVIPVVTANAVSLSWSDGVTGTYGLAGYWIFKALNGYPGTTGLSPTPTPIATVLETATPNLVYSWVDAPTPVNHMGYWVQPFDNALTGGIIGTPTILNLAPTPVSTVSAVNVVGGNNQVNVSWSGNAGPGFFGTPANYVIYRFYSTPTQTPTLTSIATVGYTQNNFNDFILVVTANPQVEYQVGVVDAFGNTSDLTAISNPVTTSNLGLPLQPTVLPLAGATNSLLYSWIQNPQSDQVDSYYLFGQDWPTLTATTTPTPVVNLVPSPTMSYSNPGSSWSSSIFYLLAHNSVGYSKPATLSGIPVPPYQVTAIPTSSQQVLVTWNLIPTPNAKTAVDGFNIYRSNISGAEFVSIGNASPAQTNFIDPNAQPGKNYFYRVTAKGHDVIGDELSESPLYPTPVAEAGFYSWPSTPMGLSAQGGINQTTLYWSYNPTDEFVTDYLIYKNGNLTPVLTVMATLSPTNTLAPASPSPTATITPTPNLTPLQTQTATITPSPTPTGYYVTLPDNAAQESSYQIVAQNIQGFSTPSNTVSILCDPIINPTAGLTPPQGFTPTPKATPAYPPVVWISGITYPGVVTGYVIYRSSDPSFPSNNTPITNVTGPVSFIPDNGAVSGYTNYYELLANDTNHISVNPLPGTAPVVSVDVWPNVPSSMACQPASTSINLSWAAPIGNLVITGYEIHRSTCPTCPQTLLATGVSKPTYQDNLATPRVPYFYEVDSVASNGLTSAQSSASGLAVSPVSLQNTPYAASNNLNWSPVSVATPSNITGYVVYRMTLQNPATQIPVSFTSISPLLEGINNTVYADINVTEATTYAYEVAPAALNPAGGYILGPFSNAVTQSVFPQPVADLEAASGDGIVQLRWDYQGTADNAFTYTIMRKLGAAPDIDYQVLKSGFSGINYTDSPVQNKTFYDYEVIAADANGQASTAQYVTALPAKPPIVTDTAVSLSQSQGGTIQGNTLIWSAANMMVTVINNGVTSVTSNVENFDPANMYPLGGYLLSRSTDGGGIYTYTHIISAPTPSSGATIGPAAVTYFDPVQLVQGNTNTYLIQAFDAPPDLPLPLAQAVTQSWVHLSNYNLVTAYPLNAGAALDLNAIRPFGTATKVHIRFVVTTPGNVNIKVYALNGTFIKELVNRWFTSGVYGTPDSPYPLIWDARNMNGTLVASGVYLITVEVNGHQEIDKIAVIK